MSTNFNMTYCRINIRLSSGRTSCDLTASFQDEQVFFVFFDSVVLRATFASRDPIPANGIISTFTGHRSTRRRARNSRPCTIFSSPDTLICTRRPLATSKQSAVVCLPVARTTNQPHLVDATNAAAFKASGALRLGLAESLPVACRHSAETTTTTTWSLSERLTATPACRQSSVRT